MIREVTTMAWTDNIPAWGNQVSDDVGKIKDNFAAIKESFAGASAPTNPAAGQIWLDTTTHLLKIRNEANNAWQSVWDMAANKPVIANLSGDITGAMIAAAIKDAAAGVASLRTLGTGATQAMPGNLSPPPPAAIAGDYLIIAADTNREKTGTTKTKIKEIIIPRPGTFRIKFDLCGAPTGYAQIYRNGSAVGVVRSKASASVEDFSTFSEDVAGWDMGDLCQIYAWGSTAGAGARIRIFRLYEGNVFARAHVTLD